MEQDNTHGNSDLRCVEVISSHPLTITAVEAALAKARTGAFVVRKRDDAGGPTFSNILPSVVIIDLCALPADIRQVLKTFKGRSPQTKCVVLVQADEACEKKILSLLYMGIENFVLLNENWADILPETICAAVSGEPTIPEWILKSYVRQVPSLIENISKTQILTHRESEVLRLLLQDYSNKEIAVVLQISVRTVKFHVSHVLRKLHVNRRRSLQQSLEGTAEFLPLPFHTIGGPDQPLGSDPLVAAVRRKVSRAS